MSRLSLDTLLKLAEQGHFHREHDHDGGDCEPCHMLIDCLSKLRDADTSTPRQAPSVEAMARALMDRHDFWNALRREDRALPGEYDDLADALASVASLAPRAPEAREPAPSATPDTLCDECGCDPGQGTIHRAFAEPHEVPCPKCSRATPDTERCAAVSMDDDRCQREAGHTGKHRHFDPVEGEYEWCPNCGGFDGAHMVRECPGRRPAADEETAAASVQEGEERCECGHTKADHNGMNGSCWFDRGDAIFCACESWRPSHRGGGRDE